MSDAPEVKKGNKSWRPSQRSLVRNKIPGYQYRWVANDPENVAKKLDDGWDFASKLHGDTSSHESADSKDGKPLTSVTTHRERVLMVIPQDDYDAHRAYFDELTNRQLTGHKRRLQDDLTDAATKVKARPSKVHGSIVIE